MAASPLDPFRAVGTADSLTMGQDKKTKSVLRGHRALIPWAGGRRT
jgi:hypothetical protein